MADTAKTNDKDNTAKLDQKAQKYRKDLKEVKRCPVIDRKQLNLTDEDFLGGGGFGSVYKATYNETMKVVFKAIDHHRFNKIQKKQIAACKEARNMCAMEHLSIVKFYGIVLDDKSSNYGVVMELMEHGSLKDLVSKVELPGGIKVEMMMDISNAMNYLHRQKLIHADMKLANIMIDDKLRAKLGDFGVAMFQGRTSELSSKGQRAGTLSHMAPELFIPELAGLKISKNSFECDVWSFGITLYELLLKKTPFTGRGVADDIIVRTIAAKDRMRDNCKEELKDCAPQMLVVLAVLCLEYDPNKRLKFRVIYDILYKDYVDNHKQNHIKEISKVVRALKESCDDPSTFSRESLDKAMEEEQELQGDRLQTPAVVKVMEELQHQMANMNLQNKENFEAVQKQIHGIQDTIAQQNDKLEAIETQITEVQTFQVQQGETFEAMETQITVVQESQVQQNEKLEAIETQITEVQTSQAHQQSETSEAMETQISEVQTFQDQQQSETSEAMLTQITEVQTSQVQQPSETFETMETQTTVVQESQAQQQSEPQDFETQPPNDPMQQLAIGQLQAPSNEPSTLTPKQERLNKYWILFLDNLIATNITDYLRSENILTLDDVQRVERLGVTDRDKARTLLDLLLTKGDKAIYVLCLAVRKERQDFLANAIEYDDPQRQNETSV